MPKNHSMSCEYPEGCSCGASEFNTLENAATERAEKRNWSRGYYCAVAQLLRLEGLVSPDVSDLFRSGGGSAEADPEDLELFREHGLVPKS